MRAEYEKMLRFATVFKSVREDLLKMKQVDFGSRIGASRQLVSRVERGQAEYSLTHLINIERLTGLPLSQLLNLLEPTTPPSWLNDYITLNSKQRRLLDGFIVNGIKMLKDN